MKMRRNNQRSSAVFLDRDGTLIREGAYISRPEQVQLYPSAVQALKRLRSAGLFLILVTNQSGIARGYFRLNQLKAIHRKLVQLLKSKGIRLDGIYYCSHHPKDRCSCRKPAPGMLKKAARDHHLDLKRSYVVGDRFSDILLARRVGAISLLVLTGAGRKERRLVKADHVTQNMASAAEWILKREKEKKKMNPHGEHNLRP